MLTLLNTRPAKQSAELNVLVHQFGWDTVNLPQIEIVALPWQQKSYSLISSYDFVILVSVNAVQHAHEYLILNKTLSNPVDIYAIGAKTFEALQQLKIPGLVKNTDSKQFDSEALLSQISKKNVAGKKVLIIKGEKGRNKLELGLISLGCKVSKMDVYLRQDVKWSFETWEIFRQSQNPICLFTSVSSFEFFRARLVFFDTQCKCNVLYYALSLPAIVFSQRIEKEIRNLGWLGNLKVVNSQSNLGIIEALEGMS